MQGRRRLFIGLGEAGSNVGRHAAVATGWPSLCLPAAPRGRQAEACVSGGTPQARTAAAALIGNRGQASVPRKMLASAGPTGGCIAPTGCGPHHGAIDSTALHAHTQCASGAASTPWPAGPSCHAMSLHCCARLRCYRARQQRLPELLGP